MYVLEHIQGTVFGFHHLISSPRHGTHSCARRSAWDAWETAACPGYWSIEAIVSFLLALNGNFDVTTARNHWRNKWQGLSQAGPELLCDIWSGLLLASGAAVSAEHKTVSTTMEGGPLSGLTEEMSQKPWRKVSSYTKISFWQRLILSKCWEWFCWWVRQYTFLLNRSTSFVPKQTFAEVV